MRIYNWFFLALIYTSSIWGTLTPFESELLPQTHPLFEKLEILCNDPQLFDSWENCINQGFIIKNPLESLRHWSVMVLAHPSLPPGFIIKKYSKSFSREHQLNNYLLRLRGAKVIAYYIELKKFRYLTVPKKWLYPLPAIYNDSNGNQNYLLICEELDIVEGGYWGGENLRLYQQMALPMMTELCTALYDLCGCDAWPQNLPFTKSNQIAFIDTEHLGLTYGDFMTRLTIYINPALHGIIVNIWQLLEKQSKPWFKRQQESQSNKEKK